MKKLALSFLTAVLMIALSVCVSADDPIISIDFDKDDHGVTLVNAEIVEDATRGKVLKVNGIGPGGSKTNQSYGLYETEIFQDNSWEDGMTISMWFKTDVGTKTLHGTAPLYSFDMAGVGYIAVVSSLESAINTDGNDTAWGISPRVWNDPASAGGGVNKTTPGAWTQLTVVYAQDGIHIYVNGELYSEPGINAEATMDDLLFELEFCPSLRLGSWLCSWWQFGDYEGMIDDVQVFQTALDDGEVADHYKATYIEQTVFEEAPSVEESYTAAEHSPVKVLDFEGDNAEIELVNAEIVSSDKGKSIEISGTGNGTNGTSYGLWTTDLFKNTDWSKGMTVDFWVKANKSDTLLGGAPIYSLDIANIGYIGLVSHIQSGINTDGNDTTLGIEPRVYNDPTAMGDPATMTREEWLRITVAYGPETMSIYQNGELVSSPMYINGAGTDLLRQMNLVPSLRLGSWLCSWWNFGDFEGLIDDFAIYDAELNPLEVKNLAATGSTVGNGTTAPAEPETTAPETEAPETEAPETEAPETEAAETTAPETEPETVTVPAEPETTASETKAPETFDAALIAVAAIAISGFAAYKAKKRD